MTITRIEPGQHFSAAVSGGGHLYISGTIADDHNGSIEVQTQQVLARIDALLAKAGLDKSRLLSATVYLPHIRDFEAMNRIWDKWVDPENKPARATVEARLAIESLRVEISAVALMP
ncbi:RidA family protein [Devosia rhodophyticola]|uniref:RidA family protein n=1 Tax=Devosia rhodophyticola TaxID=3026423 RepID=A0ABY7YTV4_9HYPH|nr:RidA family protein [Devosia rhodophyticola]WDR04739.1 RidA family protein [Devosia rhodophyticola]